MCDGNVKQRKKKDKIRDIIFPRSIAGVPSSQALLGYLVTAPPSVCVPDVIGALACEFQTKLNQKKTNMMKAE